MDYETELYEDVMEYEELKKMYEEEHFREYICEDEEHRLVFYADEIERREEEIKEMKKVVVNMKLLGDKSKSYDTDLKCPEDQAEVIKEEDRQIREEGKNEQQAQIKEDKIIHDELMAHKYDFDEADRNLGISTFQVEQDIAAEALEEVNPVPPTLPQNISTPKKHKRRGATHFTPKKNKESYYVSER